MESLKEKWNKISDLKNKISNDGSFFNKIKLNLPLPKHDLNDIPVQNHIQETNEEAVKKEAKDNKIEYVQGNISVAKIRNNKEGKELYESLIKKNNYTKIKLSELSYGGDKVFYKTSEFFYFQKQDIDIITNGTHRLNYILYPQTDNPMILVFSKKNCLVAPVVIKESCAYCKDQHKLSEMKEIKFENEETKIACRDCSSKLEAST